MTKLNCCIKRSFRIAAFLLYGALHLSSGLFSQSVGIGTTTPHVRAALEVRSTNKGVLFPRLTSAQRNAIINPPDGLHVYNRDEGCLNYYSLPFQTWNCYCEMDSCKIATIRITENATGINFNNTYFSKYPGKSKFIILIDSDVTIQSTDAAVAAIDFSTTPGTAQITIINRGNIVGSGGVGGRGASGHVGGCTLSASSGFNGGHAIKTKIGIMLAVKNYGIIGGGGGGGGGGGRNVIGEYGGGAGGGAGSIPGNGGEGGGITTYAIACFTTTIIAQSGQPGTLTAGGLRGLGANGAGAGNGGTGGGLGQAGQNGTSTGAGTGGAAGKAISGGSGNIITNFSSGQSFGIVD